MNELELIRAINDAFEEVSKNTDAYDKRQFFITCKKPIRDFIELKMPSVLFFGLSVGNLNDNNYELLKSDDSDTEFNYFGEAKNNKIQMVINKFLDDTHNNTIINLTSILLKAEYGPDLFLSEFPKYFEKYKANDIITSCNKFGERPYSFNLSNMSETMDFNQFKNEENNIIETNKFIELIGVNHSEFIRVIKYLWHYKAISREIRHLSPIIHLIRPRMAKPEYNLLLTIATKEELDSQQIAFLNDVVYRIMSMAAMKGERERADREFVEKALAYKHTIFNLSPATQQWIETAKNCSDDKTIVDECLNNAIKNFAILDICNRAIYNHIGLEEDYSLSDKTIIEIIDFLKENHTIPNKIPKIRNNLTDTTLIYKPSVKTIADSFIVLWNFWHNAVNRSRSNEFEIIIFENDGRLLLSFINDVPNGLIEKASKSISFLRNEIREPTKKNGGLVMSRQIMNQKLGWNIVSEHTHFQDNKFKVTIHLKPS